MTKLTQERLEAIRKRSELEEDERGSWHKELMTAREDIPVLLAEIGRLRNRVDELEDGILEYVPNHFDLYLMVSEDSECD